MTCAMVFLYVRVFKPFYLEKKSYKNKKNHFNIKGNTLISHHYN